VRRQTIISGVFLGLFALGLTGGGAFILVVQQTGERAEATVTECRGRPGRQSCTATWVEGGNPADDGRVVTGTIDGAGPDDIGKTLAVRLSGGRAYTTSLRVPLLLLASGITVAVLGAISLSATARKARATDADPAPAPMPPLSDAPSSGPPHPRSG
jgi:hypothetical protein